MRGLDHLLSRIGQMPDQAKRAAEAAARQTARDVVRRAQALAPVKTGALRASIASRMLQTGAAVDARCPYAVLVEMGARNCPARPFLLPAARSARYHIRAARNIQEALK